MWIFPPRFFSLAPTFFELLSVSGDGSAQFQSSSVLLQNPKNFMPFSFFLLFKTRSGSFLLANLTIVFVLFSLWQATIICLLIDIPTFSNIFMIISSKFFIFVFSGMPSILIRSCLEYCLSLYWWQGFLNGIDMRDNLGKMAKKYLKITKLIFLGKTLCVGMGEGGSWRTWEWQASFWCSGGIPQSLPLEETLGDVLY